MKKPRKKKAKRRWWNTRYEYWNGREEEIFDTLVADAPCVTQWTLFQRPIGMPDERGVAKTNVETSMCQAGQLWMPLQFDAASVHLYFEEATDRRGPCDPDQFRIGGPPLCGAKGDILEFLRNVHIRYVTGMDHTQASIAGAMFDPVISVTDAEIGAYRLMETLEAEGTRHFTKKIDAGRLHSGEPFQVRVEIERPLKLHGPLTVKVALKGIMWRPGKPGPGTGPKLRRDKVRYHTSFAKAGW